MFPGMTFAKLCKILGLFFINNDYLRFVAKIKCDSSCKLLSTLIPQQYLLSLLPYFLLGNFSIHLIIVFVIVRVLFSDVLVQKHIHDYYIKRERT